MAQEISRLADEKRELALRAIEGERAIKELRKVKLILTQHLGVDLGYRWVDELEGLLKYGQSRALEQSIQAIEYQLGRIKKMIGVNEAYTEEGKGDG